MGEVITSNQNKLIKHIKSLSQKKSRDEHNEFIIEGIKLIKEAVQYEASFVHVLVSQDKSALADIKEILSHPKLSGSDIVNFVDDKIFNEISETEAPQGILAVVRKTVFETNDFLSKEILNVIILDEVRDPGNMGTIIRTADACGLDAVILSKGCTDVYSGKVVRSTMGSIFHIPIITGVNTVHIIEEMNSTGILTLGADPYGEVLCTEIPRVSRNAIAIGNESKGLSEEVEACIKAKVRIPMPGKAESLNAGIAAALMMYEVVVRKNY